MATFSNMISVFFLVLFVSVASGSAADDLTKSINTFSTYLFKEVSGEKDHDGKNIFTSALSAHIAMSLLSYGAKEQTLKDMDKSLNYTNDDTKAAYKDAIKKMQSQLKLADKVYVDKNEQLNNDFQENAANIFDSDVEYVDFSNNTDAANKINTWVEKNTADNIKNFANASDIDNTTKVVIVNTLYAKKDWANKFDKKNTNEEEFYVDNNNSIVVETMHQQCQTNYGENADLDAKILELAFNDNKTFMIFILPNNTDGLKDLEEKLKKTDMKQLVKSLQSENVDVSMPKFQINTTANLNEALKNLGMGIVFNDYADFGGILANSNEELKVFKVFQKANIDLNEDGVTASGATGEYTVKKYSRKRNGSKEFKADHPYFYALYNEDDQIVFSGHFTGKK